MEMVEICLIWPVLEIMMNKLQTYGNKGKIYGPLFFKCLLLFIFTLCISQICVASKKVLLIQGFMYNLLYCMES